MFHRWTEILIRRARLVLALGLLATVLAGVFGVGVFDKLGQGGFDDPSSEAAQELAQEQDVFGNKSVDVVAIYRARTSPSTTPRSRPRSTRRWPASRPGPRPRWPPSGTPRTRRW